MILSLRDLRELFAKHCACRPLDVTRGDHTPDCVTGVLDDVQIVLRGAASSRDRYEAVKRCDRYAQGDYTALCGRDAT